MTEPFIFYDRDGDELAVRPVDYDGVPHAAIGILGAGGRVASFHIPPDRAWEVCEAILEAAGANAGSTPTPAPTPKESSCDSNST